MTLRAEVGDLVLRAQKRILTPTTGNKRRDEARLAAAIDAVEKADIHTRRQGNFTVVMLANDSGTFGMGISKRMPDDIDDGDIGYNIALMRAVEDALKGLLSL